MSKTGTPSSPDDVKRKHELAAASLELAKEGKVELRQSDTFAPIQLRKKDRHP